MVTVTPVGGAPCILALAAPQGSSAESCPQEEAPRQESRKPGLCLGPGDRWNPCEPGLRALTLSERHGGPLDPAGFWTSQQLHSVLATGVL